MPAAKSKEKKLWHHSMGEEPVVFTRPNDGCLTRLPRGAKVRDIPWASNEYGASGGSESSSSSSISAPQVLPWEGLGRVPDLLKDGRFGSVLIVGPSGSGKTSLLKNLQKEVFPQHAEKFIPSGGYDHNKGRSIVDAFGSAADAKEYLGHVGMGSIPEWGKPYEALSRGNRYRASVAIQLAKRQRNTPCIFDEWTSVLDRGVAMGISLSMAKMMKKAREKKGDQGPWVFAACHDDVAKYLQPRFIVYCSSGSPPVCSLNRNYEATPLRESVFLTENVPRGKGIRHFAGAYSFKNPETTFRAQRKFVLDEIKPLADGRPRFKTRPGSKDVVVEYIIFYQNGSEQFLRADKKDTPGDGCVRTRRDVRLTIENGTYYFVVDGVKHELERDVQPMGRNMFAFRVDGQCVDIKMYYDNVDTPFMVEMGWYVPEVYAEKSFQKLQCGVVETRPPFRNSPDNEDRGYGNSYLCVTVPVSEKVKQATKALDDDFSGTSVFEVPSLPRDARGLKDFHIGVLCGQSGSGKSSLARLKWGCGDSRSYDWVSFSQDGEALAREVMEAVCLKEDVYQRPYATLSGGESHRADIAVSLKAAIVKKRDWLIRETVVLEEFTSTLDRQCARKVATGLQSLVRKYGLSVVVLSCHRDFIGPNKMNPDWVMEFPSRRFMQIRNRPGAADFKNGQASPQRPLHNEVPFPGVEQLVRRPVIKLEIKRCFPEIWRVFRDSHYKDHTLQGGAASFVGLLNDQPVLFSSWIPEPQNFIAQGKVILQEARAIECDPSESYQDREMAKKTIKNFKAYDSVIPSEWISRPLMREHRTVVLEDFQGLGIGSLACKAICQMFQSIGIMAFSKSKHHTYAKSRAEPLWKVTPSVVKDKDFFRHSWMGAYRADGFINEELKCELATQCKMQPPRPMSRVPRDTNYIHMMKDHPRHPKFKRHADVDVLPEMLQNLRTKPPKKKAGRPPKSSPANSLSSGDSNPFFRRSPPRKQRRVSVDVGPEIINLDDSDYNDNFSTDDSEAEDGGLARALKLSQMEHKADREAYESYERQLKQAMDESMINISDDPTASSSSDCIPKFDTSEIPDDYGQPSAAASSSTGAKEMSGGNPFAMWGRRKINLNLKFVK